VALVTGASRGFGRGVALGLAHAGAKVFATGRSVTRAELGSDITAITCDHTNDRDVPQAFQRIGDTTGRLDILVNVAWGGCERMVEDGQLTFISPFWRQPAWRWDAMVTAGVRAAFVASLSQRASACPRRDLMLSRGAQPVNAGYRLVQYEGAERCLCSAPAQRQRRRRRLVLRSLLGRCGWLPMSSRSRSRRLPPSHSAAPAPSGRGSDYFFKPAVQSEPRA
jgi:NAD(P)-dependent dehydrogenase (short-subunit alcohol dehydrogenase family)